MIKKLQIICWGLWALICVNLLKRKRALIGGIIVNEKCNLQCLHCHLAGRKGIEDLSYEEIEEGLKILYKTKARSLVIGGGEPFLWNERGLLLEDIVRLARRVGFYYIGIYTNGTFPLNISSDIIFVSLDGLKEMHDQLRQNPVFDIVMKNIEQSSHNNICINFTINALNKEDIEPFCEYISKIANVRGIFFYFHTPYYGVDELFIGRDEKRRLIKKIILLKKRGYRIWNSYTCLNGVYEDTWNRPSEYCYIYANKELYQCCRSFGKSNVCKECGYLSYPELQYLMQCRPTAIASALRFL